MPTASAQPDYSRNASLLTGTAQTLQMQLLRCLVVGGAAFAVDFATLVLLAEWGCWDHLTAAAAGFLAGLIVNYYLSVTWVFHQRSLTNRQSEFLIFSAVGIAGLAMTELILFAGTNVSGLDYRISKVLAVVAVLFWNFGLRKLLLFRAGD